MSFLLRFASDSARSSLQYASPALTRNDLDDSTSDARLVEVERRAEDVERSYKARMQHLEDDYRLALQLVK